MRLLSSPAATGVRWDLGELYADPADPRLREELEGARGAAAALAARCRGRVAALDAPALAAAVDEWERVEAALDRVLAYAELLHAADTASPRAGALLSRAQECAAAVQAELAFLPAEWAAVDGARAEGLLSDPALLRRRTVLAAHRRRAPYLRPPAEERILQEMEGPARHAWLRLYDETLAGVRVDGGTLHQALARLHAPRAAERRAAADAVGEALRAHAPLFARVLDTLVAGKGVVDRLRGYATPMQASLEENGVSAAAAEAMLRAVEERRGIAAAYCRLKARLLGVPRLSDADRWAPLPGGDAPALPFSRARRLVGAAFRDASPGLGRAARALFTAARVDAEVRPGKRAGAFARSAGPHLRPWLMLSYAGSPGDVLTLAHEVGHGVHLWLARGRGFWEQTMPPVTAEIASTFGELLACRRLGGGNAGARLAALCHRLDASVSAVFRCAALTRMEQQVHSARRAGRELAPAGLAALWLHAHHQAYDGQVDAAPAHAWGWAGVGHFFGAPFYLYAYPFGELVALALLRARAADPRGFGERYLSLLSAGSSLPTVELLGAHGLAVEDPAFWHGGLDALEAMVAEAAALAGA